MKLSLLVVILLTVIALVACKIVRNSAFRINKVSRQHLSHTKYILAQFQHLKDKHLLRHNLNTHAAQLFQQSTLQTNHYGFHLHLKVNGIDYKMSMDTGSSDIFIKGQKGQGLPEKRYVSGEDYQKKRMIQIGYLDGFLDTYETVLDVEFNNHTFDTPLLVAYKAPKQFEDVQGLIGLSYPQLARHQPTFIQTLINNRIIQKNAYGMNLNLVVDNRSFVSFGQPDTQLYEGQLQQHTIKGASSIIINFNSIKIGNNKQIKLKRALLDTGNTCISIPHKFQSQILKGFKTKSNQCGFIVQQNVPMFSLLSCRVKNFDELPLLTLNIDNKLYTIQKQFYLQRCVQNPEQVKEHPGWYWCDTYIQSTKNYDSQLIFLGDAFFNRFYTFFDLDNKKVGIAKNKQIITFQDIKNLDNTYDPEDWKEISKNYHINAHKNLKNNLSAQ